MNSIKMHSNFHVFIAVLVLSFAFVKSIDYVCNTSVPPNAAPNGYILSKMSAAFLQIFRDQKIQCSGYIESWKFRADVNKLLRPTLSVWEQFGGTNSTDPLRFALVGTNSIVGQLEPLGNEWLQYRVPEIDRILIDVGDGSKKQLFLGLFYQNTNISTNDTLSIYYLDKFKSAPNYNYQQMPNSTIAGFLSLPDIIMAMQLANGSLIFDSQRMGFDMRLPYLQAFIAPRVDIPPPLPPTTPTTTRRPATTKVVAPSDPPPVTAEPSTAKVTPSTQTLASITPEVFIESPTTKRRPAVTTAKATTLRTGTPRRPATTTITTTTTTAPATIPVVTCYVPPQIEHAELISDLTGVIGEAVNFQCSYGYKMIDGSGTFICQPNGFWLGSGNCMATSAACNVPMSAGYCGGVLRKWYYDRRSKTCQWFYYSGCGGTANRFETYERCLETCGFLMSPVTFRSSAANLYGYYPPFF